MCVPRFDGDPVFCALLDDDSDQGRFDIELQDCVSITQAYERNTAILRTEMADSHGARLEIVDFAPRFHQHGRMFAPVSIVRIVHRLAGRPRIRVRFAPRCEYGAAMPAMTFGSHHIRADVPAYRLRLTTDAPITHVIESTQPTGRGHADLYPRSRRDARGEPARDRAAYVRGDRALLAPLGAQPGSAIRMAAGSDSRGHHAEAQYVRRHWWDCRRVDDVGAGSAAHAANLGLSLLLAARCVLRDQCAEPARCDRFARALSALHRKYRRGSARRFVAAGVWVKWHRRTRRDDAQPHCPGTAAWGQCASATSPSCRLKTTFTARRSLA